MIVEPDFLDHWKTRLLVRLLGTETAPLLLLRLWSHCQLRKTDRFTGWKPTVLASVCRWESHGDTEGVTLWQTMVETGFIKVEGDVVIVHGWQETNAFLFSAWENGKRGGRPSKSRTSAECKTGGYPAAIPPATHGQTYREEKRREEKKGTGAGALPPEQSASPSEAETQKFKEGSPAEIPSEADVLAFAAGWQGDMHRGIQGPIPETWAMNLIAYMAEGNRVWPKDWKPWFVRKFVSDRLAGFPRAFGGVPATHAATNGNKSLGGTNAAKIRALEEEVTRHVGNPENGIGSLQRKKDALPEFLKLKQKLSDMKRQAVTN